MFVSNCLAHDLIRYLLTFPLPSPPLPPFKYVCSEVTIKAVGSSAETLTATDNGDGSYTYRYTKTTATYYEITAKYSGTDLPGMPKTIEVVPAALSYTNSAVDSVVLDPKYCKLSNPNNEDIQVVANSVWQCVQAGSSNFLYVTPRDQYGNVSCVMMYLQRQSQ